MRKIYLAFSTNNDGTSMSTFYANLKFSMYSIILVEDTEGYKFGAFCTQEWKSQKYFYGTGESFIFTFKDSREEI